MSINIGRSVTSGRIGARYYWSVALLVILLIGLALRLHGIGNPILDHPGWRQGDTAAIARNFARLQFNIMYPQTTYNGRPPNYVELELQIVPFLAATLYKLFGIHEVFGRLLSLGFSLATIGVTASFARWLFRSRTAGLAAAFFYAIFPGSVYYGRTFTPDGAMVFFLTAALYAAAWYLIEDEARPRWAPALAVTLLSLAYLAKPVAVIGLAPLLGLVWERARRRRGTPWSAIAILLAVPLLVLWLYDRRVASYAEWHWTSGITQLHVLPALASALHSLRAFGAKVSQFWLVIGMLRATMLGNLSFVLAVASFAVLPWIAARSKALLWGWLLGGLAYIYVVVTVERVDYYMLPLLPLCALAIGGAIARFVTEVRRSDVALIARYALLGLVPFVTVVALLGVRAPIAAYYDYNEEAYRNARHLDRTLDPDALVVIGHYGPDVQYYIDRFGWEEDPALWTPFDQESAIRKGARYFISIEDNRLRRNLDLCAWLARFPVRDADFGWPVYETDPAKILPGAQALWRAFRSAERAGHGRAFLDAHGMCMLKAQ
ncbi:MAG TPA: glycosyltransferase family 39 protein [Xanthobacteraceae bacterium]